MHYPVMTEKHVADRWQVSLKTLRRWRLDGEGPVWHKLFRHVRYHEAKVFGDDRGFFFESFNQRDFQQATGLNVNFVQDNHSKSSKGVLRGLHYQIQHPQGKLVRVSSSPSLRKRCRPPWGGFQPAVRRASTSRTCLPKGALTSPGSGKELVSL